MQRAGFSIRDGPSHFSPFKVVFGTFCFQILIKVPLVNSVVSVHFKNIDRDASYLLDICLHADNLGDTLSVLTCKTINNNDLILG